MRKAAQQTWFAPAVAGLIEIYSRSFTRQVDYVVGSGSIYICDTNTRVLKLIGIIKPGRVIHGDFGAESTVAKVGPVADLAVANPDEGGQTIAAHVSQVNRLCAVGKNQTRASLLIRRFADMSRAIKAFLSQ